MEKIEVIFKKQLPQEGEEDPHAFTKTTGLVIIPLKQRN